MAKYVATIDRTMLTTFCVLCGIEFGMPEQYYNNRRNDHNVFHCPNGHGQVFTAKTDAELLQEQVENQARLLARRQNELDDRGAIIYKQTKKIAQLEKKISPKKSKT